MGAGILGRSAVRRRSGGFSPKTSVTSGTLVSWWDASQLGLANNASIATMTDFSGNGNHGTQATGTQRPLLKTTIQNGLPVARLDGTDDHWRDPLQVSGTKTILLVFKARALPGAGTGQILDYLKYTTGPTFTQSVLLNLGGFQPYSWRDDGLGSTLEVGLADALDTNAHVWLRTYNAGTISDPASYTSNLDGATKTVIASGSTSRTSTDLGAFGASVDSGGTPTSPATVDFMERCIYNAVLSAGDRTSLINYARAKWAI